MSRFKIKLRLPEQDSPGAGSASIGSTSSPSSSSANPTAAAPSAPSAATAPAAAEGLDAPTPLTSQAMRDNDRASSSSIQPAGITQRASQAASGGEGDVSMAASSMADESEDELASTSSAAGDGDEASEAGRGTPSSSTAAGRAALSSSTGDHESPAGLTKLQRQKRSARLAELEKMTAEEIDALPAAKRRVGAKARGASGPGRGWRKGLKMGDKPKYTLPDATPIAEGTPTSFDDSRRGSPFSAMSGSPEPSTALLRAGSGQGSSSSYSAMGGRPPASSASGLPATTSGGTPLVFAAPGQRAKKGELSHTAAAALAGKSILPSGRAPVAVAAAMAFGPPVKPPVKIVNVFPPAYPATLNRTEVGKRTRKWVKGERQWVNLAGRVVSVGSAWWGGEDGGFDPQGDAEREQMASTAAASGGAAIGGGTGQTSAGTGTLSLMAGGNAGSPGASRHSTPVGPPIAALSKAEASVLGAANAATSTATRGGRGGSTSSRGGRGGSTSSRGGKSGGAGSPSPFISAGSPSGTSTPAMGAPSGAQAGSPSSSLPKPKFQPGGGGADWKSGGGAGAGSPVPAGTKK